MDLNLNILIEKFLLTARICIFSDDSRNCIDNIIKGMTLRAWASFPYYSIHSIIGDEIRETGVFALPLSALAFLTAETIRSTDLYRFQISHYVYLYL